MGAEVGSGSKVRSKVSGSNIILDLGFRVICKVKENEKGKLNQLDVRNKKD